MSPAFLVCVFQSGICVVKYIISFEQITGLAIHSHTMGPWTLNSMFKKVSASPLALLLRVRIVQS